MDFVREIPSMLHLPYERFETDLNVPITPMFEERQKLWNQKMDSRDRNESWEECQGDYAIRESSLSRTLSPFFPEKNGISLSGRELIIAARIDQLSKANSDQPISAVDLGGMLSLSWVKLAVYFQELHSSGKLLLTSTNLEFNPDLLTENNRSMGRRNTPFLDNADWEFWMQHKNLISFVDANTQTLQSKVGKPNIIHEYSSVSYHSPIPALDRMRVLSALPSNGLFVSSDLYTSAGLRHQHLPFLQREKIEKAKKQDITNFNLALAKSFLFKKQDHVLVGNQSVSLDGDISLSLILPAGSPNLKVE